MSRVAATRPQARTRDGLGPAAGFVVLILLIIWAWCGTEFEPAKLASALPRLAEFLGRMVPPDLSVAETVAVSTVETLQIAFLGTVLSAVASLLLGLLAAPT